MTGIKNKLLFFPLLCFLLFFPSIKPAKAEFTFEDFGLYLGTLAFNPLYVQVDGSGNTSFFDINPYLFSMFRYRFSTNTAMDAGIGMFFPQSGEESNLTKMTGNIQINFIYDPFLLFNMPFNFRGGISSYFTLIGGSGGSTRRNNGTSTSTFYNPESSNVSVNFSIDLGMENYVHKKVSLRYMLHIFSAFENASRHIGYGLAASYHFGDFDE